MLSQTDQTPNISQIVGQNSIQHLDTEPCTRAKHVSWPRLEAPLGRLSISPSDKQSVVRGQQSNSEMPHIEISDTQRRHNSFVRPLHEPLKDSIQVRLLLGADAVATDLAVAYGLEVKRINQLIDR